MSATKASTGHLLGGAGAIEAIFTVMALHERIAPPTINLTEQDPEIPLDVVTAPRPLGDGDLLAISNSFGFGGHNAVVAFRDRLARPPARAREAPTGQPRPGPLSFTAYGRQRVSPGPARRGSLRRQPTLCSQTTDVSVARVAERLEFVVPGLTERESQLAVELARVRCRRSPSRSAPGPRG